MTRPGRLPSTGSGRERKSYISRFTGWLLPLISHQPKGDEQLDLNPNVTATLGFHGAASREMHAIQSASKGGLLKRNEWVQCEEGASHQSISSLGPSASAERLKQGSLCSARVAVPPLPIGMDSETHGVYHIAEDIMFEDIPEESVRVHDFSLQSSPREEFSVQSSPRSPRSSKYSSKYSSHRSTEAGTHVTIGRRNVALDDASAAETVAVTRVSSQAGIEEYDNLSRARRDIVVEEVSEDINRAAVAKAPKWDVWNAGGVRASELFHHGWEQLERRDDHFPQRASSFESQHAPRSEARSQESWSARNTVHEEAAFPISSTTLGIQKPFRVGSACGRTESLIRRIEMDTAMLEEFDTTEYEEDIAKWGVLC